MLAQARPDGLSVSSKNWPIIFAKCVVCVTWDDELRTIKIAILSVAFNREQLEAFLRLFEACFLFSKPMESRSLLQIYLFSLVISYKY